MHCSPKNSAASWYFDIRFSISFSNLVASCRASCCLRDQQLIQTALRAFYLLNGNAQGCRRLPLDMARPRACTSVEKRQNVKRIALARLFFDSFVDFMLFGW